MADLKELMEKVTVDEVTMQFAGHFKTKSSVKNLLRKIGNAKLLAPIVEDEEVGTCGLGDDATRDAILTAIVAGFDAYTAQKAAWDNAGDKHPLPERVEFFRDAVMAELDKDDDTKALVNKGIEAVKVGSHTVAEYLKVQGENEDVRKAILASIIRTVMIMTVTEEPAGEEAPKTTEGDTARDVSTGEKVEAEVITPDASSAGHTPETKPNQSKDETSQTTKSSAGEEAPKAEDDDTKREVTKTESSVEKLLKQVCGLLDKDYSNATDAEQVRAGILKSAKGISTETTEFEVKGSLTGSTVDWATLMLESMLPDQYQDKLGAIPVKEAVKLGARTIVAGIVDRCGDIPLCDAKPDDVSVSVMMGAFLMYSLLAAELPEHENIDYVLLPVLTAAMAERVGKNKATATTWATLINLSGIRKFSEYRSAVDNAVARKDERNAAVSALSGFGHALGATDAERHLSRGIELYMSLAA